VNIPVFSQAWRSVRARLDGGGGRSRRQVPFQVIVGATAWTVNGVNVFSANLVRGLVEQGVSAHILLTEDATNLAQTHEQAMPRPEGVRFESIPIGRTGNWGRHWGGMVRYLEESAPCIYLPNSDWRHSLISSQLSNDVVVVGIVHSDDPMHYDHVRRVGRYWNAIVAVSDAVARKTVELCPDLAGRITTIPIGVRIPGSRPPRPPASDRLRVIYHGILKQHQKRVLDFPRIVRATLDLGVPIELTIVGSGPDESALRRAAESLVSQGAVRFLGVVSQDDMPAVLEAHDVYLLTSEFEGMPNALIEAMGRGLVPVVSRTASGIPELVREGKNGFVVPIGDADAFADRLRTLWRRPFRRRRMAARAYRTVSRGHFGVEYMVKSYLDVFDRAWDDARAGRFVRPKGPLSSLPAEVAGVSVFPVDTPHVVPDLGAFPSLEDAEDYDDEIRMLARTRRSRRVDTARSSPASLDRARVIVASPVWTHNGVNLWSEELVRGLRNAGVDARLLLTEESTRLVTIDEPRMARPSDIPVEELQVTGADNWGARWGAMVRTLEAAAPCVYLPNYDWRHSCVVPALSGRVAVVGLLHDGGPLYAEHASRLGDYWNAVVATSRPTARHVRMALPQLSDRVSTIPHGVRVPTALSERAWGNAVGRLLIPPDACDGSVLSFIRAIVQSSSRWSLIAVDPPEADREWLAAAGVRLVIRPGRLVWLELCASSHFVLSAESDPAVRPPVIEAMGHGCVPITVGSESPNTAASRHLRDTGITILDGQWHDADRLLQELAQDADKRNRMAAAAHRMARETAFCSEQMIAAYLELFQHVIADANSGIFARCRGVVLPPPALVGGTSIFPVPLTHSTDAGNFPTPEDETSYRAELAGGGDPATVGLQ
jgi:glycosyltransferase involved in cell wall biosynthesis